MPRSSHGGGFNETTIDIGCLFAKLDKLNRDDKPNYWLTIDIGETIENLAKDHTYDPYKRARLSAEQRENLIHATVAKVGEAVRRGVVFEMLYEEGWPVQSEAMSPSQRSTRQAELDEVFRAKHFFGLF